MTTTERSRSVAARGVETEEQEQARLAQAPEGSIRNALSKLPVTIREWPEGLVVELPFAQTGRTAHRVIVVPVTFSRDNLDPDPDAPAPRGRNSGWWECVVIASDHPSYPVGGYQLAIPAAEIARGRRVDVLALLSGAGA